MHGLQWDYSFPRSPHGENREIRKEKMTKRNGNKCPHDLITVANKLKDNYLTPTI
jgi:hypothetical protein